MGQGCPRRKKWTKKPISNVMGQESSKQHKYKSNGNDHAESLREGQAAGLKEAQQARVK